MTKKDSQENKKNEEKTADVLYQRLGDRWYAFSIVDDEVYLGALNQAAIQSGETFLTKE
jgi:hypothetical protein